jgi:hypothetical protein
VVDYCYDGDMKTTTPLIRFVFSTALFTAATALVAQGPPGHDTYNPPPGHGGIPPGQAKKFEDDRDRSHGHDWDHDQDHERDHVPPGQAKKYDYRFRTEDRTRFYSHYRTDVERWRGRRRPVFVMGQPIPREYVVSAVPPSYFVGAPPPPPGYLYGYYGGFVVAYNPTTRVVADVTDLASVSVTIR